MRCTHPRACPQAPVPEKPIKLSLDKRFIPGITNQGIKNVSEIGFNPRPSIKLRINWFDKNACILGSFIFSES